VGDPTAVFDGVLAEAPPPHALRVISPALRLNKYAAMRIFLGRQVRSIFVVMSESPLDLQRPLHNLLRGQILNLRCSLCSSTGALLESNFDRSLQLCRGLLHAVSADRSALGSKSGNVAFLLYSSCDNMESFPIWFEVWHYSFSSVN
jgi:hypothetical protein